MNYLFGCGGPIILCVAACLIFFSTPFFSLMMDKVPNMKLTVRGNAELSRGFCQAISRACLSVSGDPEAPLGRSSTHMSVSHTWLLSHHVIRALLPSPSKAHTPVASSQHYKVVRKKRHGSWDGCYSRATVFILSTAPKCTMWLFVPSPHLWYMHSMTIICIFISKAKVLQKGGEKITYIITHQPFFVSPSSKQNIFSQTSNKKQRHTFSALFFFCFLFFHINQIFCNDSMQILNSTILTF